MADPIGGAGIAGIDRNKPVVLVVDDDSQLRHLVTLILRREFSVFEAGDAKDALGNLRQLVGSGNTGEGCPVVLLDVMLPDTDGFSLCRRIKTDFNVPIIMFSARADEDDMRAATQSGADGYVLKPFNIQTLKEKLLQCTAAYS